MRQKKLRVLFRTAGGKAPDKELGFGHIYRCLNLAECFTEADKFFLVEDYGGVRNILYNRNISNVKFLKNEIDFRSDLDETIGYIKQKKIDIIIVDKFKIKLNYLRKIRQHAKTVFISDLYKIDFPVDLVVNGFIGFKNSKSINKYRTKCLLGPRFQILNREFSRMSSPRNKTYQLLATFGGFDEKNLVKILIKELLQLEKKIRVKIILGPATLKSESIKLLAKKYGKCLKTIQKTNSMYKEISDTKYGICSGGITTYEFASQKIPFAVVCQAKHQLKTAKELERKGIAQNFGLVNQETSKKIRLFLEEIAHNKIQIKNRGTYVNGLGALLVSNEILKL